MVYALWAPKGYANSTKIRSALNAVLSRWSQKWFVRSPPALSLHDAQYHVEACSAPGDWKAISDGVWICWSASNATAWAKSALGLHERDLTRTLAEAKLLSDFGEAKLLDLAERFSSPDQDPGDAGPHLGGLTIPIRGGKAEDRVKLWLSVRTLRSKSGQSAIRAYVEQETLASLAAEVPVRWDVRMSSAPLNLSDITGLKARDLIVFSARESLKFEALIRQSDNLAFYAVGRFLSTGAIVEQIENTGLVDPLEGSGPGDKKRPSSSLKPGDGRPEDTSPSLSDRLTVLGGLQLKLEVRLGFVEASLSDLTQGALKEPLKVDRSLNSPVDLLLNGVIIGQGEIVAVDDNFGVRVTHIDPSFP
jgi:flagellar motor switch protein FliN/FliY